VIDFGTGPCVKILDIFSPERVEWMKALNKNLKMEHREILTVGLVEEES